jgi:hypothetical protein
MAAGGRPGRVELLTGIDQKVAVLGVPSGWRKEGYSTIERGDSVGETTLAGVAPRPCNRQWFIA